MALREKPLAVALSLVLLSAPGLAGQQKPKILPIPEYTNLPPEIAATHLIKKSAPVYPASAKLLGVQGTVKVGICVRPNGRVYGDGGLWGPPSLFQAAQNAAAQYVYRPFKKDGRPALACTTVNIVFKLPAHQKTFRPPPAPQLTLETLEGFRSSIPVADATPELRRWLAQWIGKNVPSCKGNNAMLAETRIVEIPGKSPASRLYMLWIGIDSSSICPPGPCGTGGCPMEVVEDAAGHVRPLVDSFGFGYYTSTHRDSPYPYIFTVSANSPSEEQVIGYVNLDGRWVSVYCGKILDDKSYIHVCR